MQLKIQRSQRMGGVMGSTVVFCIDAQAEYTRPEADNIAKYKLGKQVIYNSRASKKHLDNMREQRDGSVVGFVKGAASLAMAALNLNISIDSLARGQHIECKDLEELLEAEDAVMLACRNLTRYLDIAATFNGSVALIDFADGEKVHTGQGSLDLLTGPQNTLLAYEGDGPETDTTPLYELWAEWFGNVTREQMIGYGAAAVGVVVVLYLFATYL
jgi:hypothetical protein